MTIRDTRSMNEQLQRGVLDGSVKNMRPNAADADYTSVVPRARQLHPSHYGTFGAGSDAMTPFMDELMPDAAIRAALREAGVRGY